MKKTKKKYTCIILFVICICIGYFAYSKSDFHKYKIAISELKNKEYVKAMNDFDKILQYKDSEEKKKECVYQLGINEYANKNYEKAICYFMDILDYSDSLKIMNNCIYDYATELYQNHKLEDALSQYKLINTYNDSNEMIYKIQLELADNLLKKQEYEEAFESYKLLNNINGQKKCIELSNTDTFVQKAAALFDNNEFDEAETIYKLISEVKPDAKWIEEIEKCEFIKAIQGNWHSYANPHDAILKIDGNTVYFLEDCIFVKPNILSGNEYTFSIVPDTKEIEYNRIRYKYALEFSDTNDTYQLCFYCPNGESIKDFATRLTIEKNWVHSDVRMIAPGDYATEQGIIDYKNLHDSFLDAAYKNAGIPRPKEDTINENPKSKDDIKPEPAIYMTHDEVLASSWGKPYDINKTTYTWGTTEQWCYSNYRYIYFKNGIVVAISE